MSIEALKWAFEQEQVPPGPRFVLVALANRANEEGGDLYPSLRWIKKKTGIPERTIRSHITDLERRGLLVKTERRREDGGRTSNEYLLPLSQPGLRFDTPPAAIAGGVDASAGGGAPHADAPRQPLPEPPAAIAGQETKEKKKEKTKTSITEGFAISQRVRDWAKRNGFEASLEQHLEHFVGHCRANQAKYVDWDEALMNCVRADWGGIRRQAGRGRGPEKPKKDFRGGIGPGGRF